MAHKQSRYQSRPKAAARRNRIVLGQRAAAWLFWMLIGVISIAIIGALYWMLTHPS
jgi:hypothetical protein